MIKGDKEILNALDVLAAIDMSRGLGKGISFVQEDAKSRCPVGDGELRNHIFTGVEGERGLIRANCYTNKEHGTYVEFGTGPKGQADHDGISPEVPVSYRQDPWWIHESQIDKSTAEKYHFLTIETKEGIFYQSSGQAANPFLYPSLADNVDKVTKIVTDEIRKDMDKI